MHCSKYFNFAIVFCAIAWTRTSRAAAENEALHRIADVGQPFQVNCVSNELLHPDWYWDGIKIDETCKFTYYISNE